MYPNHNYCGDKLMLYDQGCLHISNFGTSPVNVSIQSDECFECSLLWLSQVKPKSVLHTIVQTRSRTIIEFSTKNKFLNHFDFGQHGHYNVSIDDSHQSNIITDIPPDDAYAPLKIELWILFSIVILWFVGACTSYYISTFRWIFQTNFAQRELLNDLGTPSESGDPVPLFSPDTARSSPQNVRTGRVKCLDTFRGLTIVFMLFVNYGGGHYWFFHHAPWNGLTFADVVYPSFAFIMGMSMVLSMASLYRVTNSRKKVLLKVILRSLVLICLGIMLNSVNNPNLLKLRLPGVLQRLGLAYLIVGIIETICLQIHFTVMETGRLAVFQDWINCCFFFQWLCMIALLVLHSCLIFFLEVPGCPKGYLGPGGLSMDSEAPNCTGGATGYIDRLIFQEAHMYPRSTPASIYQTKVRYDPEGLLGTITTAFSVFMGVCATRVYMKFRSPHKLMARWILLAFIFGITGGKLCNWSKEGGFIPINKNLWSLSFACVTGGISFLTITFLYFIIDYKKIWNGSPFLDVGKNALFIYIGSILLKKTFPWDVSPLDMTTHTESLLLHTWATALWVVIGFVLSKNNIIIAI